MPLRPSLTLSSLCLLIVLALSSVAFGQSLMTFKHPGGVNRLADLDFVRGKIDAGQQPWTSVFAEMKKKAVAPQSVPQQIDSSNHVEEGLAKEEAIKVYANALAWYYTREQRYAQQALDGLQAWSTFKAFNAGSDQDNLLAGWIGALLGPAAEIMREYDQWDPADMASVQSMFRRAFYPQLNTASRWNGNVDLTQIDAIMNIAVFNEDQAEFELGLSRLRKRNPAYFYLASDGGVPPIDGDGGNHQKFWSEPVQWIDGLTQESCRDNNHHAQYALASAIHAAEVAWNQNVDIYGENTQRYTKAMELMATQLLTGDMQGTCTNCVTSKEIYTTWEMGYNHYHRRVGLDLPNTKRLIHEKVRPHGWSTWNIFYETLTHADLDYDQDTATK